MFDEFDLARVFIGSGVSFHVLLYFLDKFIGADGAFGEGDVSFDDLTAGGVWGSDDGALEDVRKFHDDAFDFEGADAVTA